MPSVYQLKSAFQGLLRPAVGLLHRAGVTANQVTVLAMAASIGYAAALSSYPDCLSLWLGLPVFLLLRMALNAIDGMLAREFGHASTLGAFLNEIGDVVSDAALIFALVAVVPAQMAGIALLAVLAMLTEFAGVCGWAICTERRYDGPFGKSDRAVALGALGLAVGLGADPAATLRYAIPVAAVLLLITVFNRIRAALRKGV